MSIGFNVDLPAPDDCGKLRKPLNECTSDEVETNKTRAFCDLFASQFYFRCGLIITHYLHFLDIQPADALIEQGAKID